VASRERAVQPPVSGIKGGEVSTDFGGAPQGMQRGGGRAVPKKKKKGDPTNLKGSKNPRRRKAFRVLASFQLEAEYGERGRSPW